MLKKRILCTIISILIILSVLPFGVSAADVQENNVPFVSDASLQNDNTETRTIYFCNSREWENVYAFGFCGDLGEEFTAEPLGCYPGVKMKYEMTNDFGHDIFSIEIPADMDYIKFNDGSNLNNRTDNIYKDKYEDNTIFILEDKVGKYWSYYTSEFDIIEDENGSDTAGGKGFEDIYDELSSSGKIYFKNSLGWSNIYAYCYGGDGEVLGYWPGTACKHEGNGIWSVEVPGEPEAFIFNSDDSYHQTESIPFIGFDKVAVPTGEMADVTCKLLAVAKFVDKDDVFDDFDETGASGKLYFKDSLGWGNIYAFTYNDTTGEISLGAWPGTACKYEGNDIWSVEVSGEPEGVLFNSPKIKKQTNEIIFKGFGATAVITGTCDYNRWNAEFVTDEDIPDDSEITNKPETGVCVDGVVYDVNVGDTVTYEVWVEAEELFEDVQAYIYYDGSKLATEAVSYYRNNGNGTNCPNLKYLAFNSKKENIVKFNASYINGMDFRDGKILVSLDFVVVDNSYSEIGFVMEEMTIKGDGSESYFEKSEPVITDGISVTREVKVKGNPEVELEAQICVNDKIYNVNVGETVTYEVWLEAERIFEDFQAYVNYDSTKLTTEAGIYIGSENEIKNCPNLNGIIFNSQNIGEVKIVSSYIGGMNFKKEKLLLTLEFEVVAAGYSEIRLVIEEMTIKGNGSESYFTRSEPVITDGIKVTQFLKDRTDTGLTPKAEICVDNMFYKTMAGDVVTYEVLVEAEKYFEDVQAVINYDAENLELLSVDGLVACPNLNKGLVFNATKPGIVRFNASYFGGIDFTDEKILVALEFKVNNNKYSEIELIIEEMTIKGDGTLSYFTEGRPVITDGITITQNLKGGNGFEVASARYVLGDANGDNKVNVKDATEIQKASAGLLKLCDTAAISADVDVNEKVNVKDATAIQKDVAGFETSFDIREVKIVA